MNSALLALRGARRFVATCVCALLALGSAPLGAHPKDAGASARELLAASAWRAPNAALDVLEGLDTSEPGVESAQEPKKPAQERPKPGQKPATKPGAKKTCVDCHQDFMKKLEGAKPHLPDLAQRCEECHDRHGLVGVLKLKQDEPALCIRCHEKAAPFAAPENAHPPGAQQKCSACHDPHAARQPKLIAAKGADLCYRCHDRAAYEKDNVHKPVTEGCLACHTAHGTNAVASAPAKGGAETPAKAGATAPSANTAAPKPHSALTPPAPELCLRCHDAKKGAFATKHDGFDVTRSDCNSCHSPHKSKRAGLVRPVVHKPAEDHDCASCHVGPDEMTAEQKALATPPLRAPAEKLCRLCHADRMQDFAGRAGAHPPVKDGKCLDCHAAHASEEKGLLSASANAACAKCHDLKAKLEPFALPNRSPHPPVMEGKCLDCHDPHGGADAAALKSAQTELCVGCHPQLAKEMQRSVQHAALEVCTSCHAGHGSVQPAMLRSVGADLCLRCHKDHAERYKNDQLHKPVAQGQCLVCHEPHASDEHGMLRKPAATLCLDCHKNVTKTLEGGSAHPPAQKGECLVCHDPHSAPRKNLLKQDEGKLCASCHGITQKEIEGFAFRHAPAQAGACLACHSAHAAPRPKLLTQAPRETCLACHGKLDLESKQPGAVAHKPFAEGECLGCHKPHGSNLRGLVKESAPALCLKCHDPKKDTMVKKHIGQPIAEVDCLTCHTPHSAQGAGLFWPFRHQPFSEQRCQECHEPGK
ncbi:MAG: cytochrome c3 family protein [Planctomycetes bacterium]|nr:cytochrome c3 family protein [Planctomycetota bacterium]